MSTSPREFVVQRSLYDLRRRDKAPGVVDLHPATLTHVYVHMDVDSRYQFATNQEDAEAFFRGVGRGAQVTRLVAGGFGGRLLEIHGPTLHIALPETVELKLFAGTLHEAFKASLGGLNAINWWVLVADTGKTLVVPGSTVHGDADLSFVSIGDAANRPAKYLARQLEITPADRRELQQFMLAERESFSGRWTTCRLDDCATVDQQTVAKAAATEDQEVRVELRSLFSWREARAAAAPMGPAGSPASPGENTHQAFGWVMRADMDGFTARVEECLNDENEMIGLAQCFYSVMEAAREFTEQRAEHMYQLPWAGDNYTGAAIYRGEDDYQDGKKRRLVELALEFDGDMKDATSSCEVDGWAFSVAGGEVSPNSNGNVFIGGVEFDGLRFLVGCGLGFGRSTQGFVDVDPDAGELALLVEDVSEVDVDYRVCFDDREKTDGTTSSLFKVASLKCLDDTSFVAATGTITVKVKEQSGEQAEVAVKPYSHD